MDMFNLMKQAQQLQKNLKAVQDDLATREVSGSAGAGMVSATFNGQIELVSLQIDPNLISPDKVQMLNDLLRAAINDGLHKAKDMARSEMGKLTGGINIPGLF